MNNRFVSAFKAPAVQLITEKGNHFVLVNSMALEGDGCFLCKPAERELTKIESNKPTNLFINIPLKNKIPFRYFKMHKWYFEKQM